MTPLQHEIHRALHGQPMRPTPQQSVSFQPVAHVTPTPGVLPTMSTTFERQLYALNRERAELRRYHAQQTAALTQRLASLSTQSNTERLRELYEEYDFPQYLLAKAIKDCEG